MNKTEHKNTIWCKI